MNARHVTIDEIRTELDGLIEFVALGASGTNSYRDGVLALVERYAEQGGGDTDELQHLRAELHQADERIDELGRDLEQAMTARWSAESILEQQAAELAPVARRRRAARRVALAVVGLPLLGGAIAVGLFFGGLL